MSQISLSKGDNTKVYKYRPSADSAIMFHNTHLVKSFRRVLDAVCGFHLSL